MNTDNNNNNDKNTINMVLDSEYAQAILDTADNLIAQKVVTGKGAAIEMAKAVITHQLIEEQTRLMIDKLDEVTRK